LNNLRHIETTCSIINGVSKMILNKNKIIAGFVTILILGLLFLSGPSTAITVLMNSIQSVSTGQNVVIVGNVTLNDYEFIQSGGLVNLTISTTGNGIIICSLPLATATNTVVSCSGNQNMTVNATSTLSFGYDYGYGYEYGYSPASGYTYNYAYSYGYGYNPYTYQDDGSYRYQWTSTSMSYRIVWTVPSSYTIGTYNATIAVYDANGALVPGATDTETVTVSSAIDYTTLSRAVRISEVLPRANSSTGGDNATRPNGQWVELANFGSSAVNVSGWLLTERDGDSITIIDNRTNTNSTIIQSGGYLVVYRNGDPNFGLHWDYDTLTLSLANGTYVDAMSYNAEIFHNLGYFSPRQISIKVDFPEGWSIILSSASTEASCNATNGTWVYGACYKATSSPSAGQANPGGLALANIPLTNASASWNLISIPVVPSNNAITSVLSSISGSYTIVWAYNASDTSDPWKRYWVNVTGNDLSYMTPNSGYWIKLNVSAETLII